MIGWWLCKLGIHRWGPWSVGRGQISGSPYKQRICQRSATGLCDAQQVLWDR